MEYKCCRAVQEAVKISASQCITQHRDFASFLNPAVLRAVFHELRDNGVFVELEGTEQHKWVSSYSNMKRGTYVRRITFFFPRLYRLVAYRMVARWIWGHRGRHNRVVLPACAVSRIRKEFPSETYVGFQYPAL